jgi:N-acetyl-D-muramate 6-phosphate phosphatase
MSATAVMPLSADVSFSAVLFDLDGTLVDSAPDLAGAANDMRVSRGLDPLPYAMLRPMVGSGARGMVGVALQVHPGHADFLALRDEFLQRYEERLTRETVVFSDMQPVLKKLTQSDIVWGIVTNKIARYAEPLVSALGLHHASAVLVCGDTTAHAKPHPAPLIEAAQRIQVQANRCLYVGDDLRDVQAGKAAGMRTAAAAWGYLGNGDSVHDWHADHLLAQPQDLLKLLGLP